MPGPITHLNTACYQITCDPRFPEIGRCPHCRSRVETQELDLQTTRESLLERAPFFCETAAIAVVRTSIGVCTECGWWVLREDRADYEYDMPGWEYIVYPLPDDDGEWSHPHAGEEPPIWKRVLNDKSRWAEGNNYIPVDEAARVFGRKARRLWLDYDNKVRRDRREWIKRDFGSLISMRRRHLEEDDPAYSLRMVAARVGVSASYLRMLERAEEAAPPSDETIERLADELRLTRGILLHRGRRLRELDTES